MTVVSLTTASLFCLQVPGIFTAKRCKSRDPGQSGLQRCALRLSIRTSSLFRAGESFLLMAQDSKNNPTLCIMQIFKRTVASLNLSYRLQVKHP